MSGANTSVPSFDHHLNLVGISSYLGLLIARPDQPNLSTLFLQTPVIE